MSDVSFLPADDGMNGYVEDTIVIDWQTPIVFERIRELTAGITGIDARLRPIFEFVRDDIADSLDVDTDDLVCTASEVLRAGHGLGYARSHLLVALARGAGVAAGFGYQRLRSTADPQRFAQHGFAVVYEPEAKRWIALDPTRSADGAEPEFTLDRHVLGRLTDPELGEETTAVVYSKPSKRIVDTLSRAGSLARIRDRMPEEH